MKNSKLYNFFLILIGIVIGSFVSYICRDISALSWLSYGIDFGLKSPAVLELGIMSLTIGFTVKLTLSTVIFIILSLIVGRIAVK